MDNLTIGRDIYNVTRLMREMRIFLEGGMPALWVAGEVSNLSRPVSGHLYFTLKDSHAQVKCVLFRNVRLRLRDEPANGRQVVVRVRPTLYETRGDFQLQVEHLEPAGEGLLRQAIEALKQRLAAEGLFDPAVKRPLPRFPAQIGVISSLSGAAIHDILTVLGRRFPAIPVVIYPSPVQGEGAVAGLCQQLLAANQRQECAVLILARGGGALEDLMAFNDEALVRAVRASGIPVVTGVGHETDVTLADLAADERAPTPSAAAERVAPDRLEWLARVANHADQLRRAMNRRQETRRQQLHALRRQVRLLHPQARLRQDQQRLDALARRLTAHLTARLRGHRQHHLQIVKRLARQDPGVRLARERQRLARLDVRLGQLASRCLEPYRLRLRENSHALQAVSPLATLARGYALAFSLPGQRLIRVAETLQVGQKINIRLHQGSLECEVVAIRNGQNPGLPD